MRALLVDDEPGILTHVADALTAAGYAVDSTGDGEEAAFLGENEPYDVAILDIGLPGRDGLTVLRGWRAAGRAFPVLLLTARGSWREKVEGIDAGADDYLAKPFATEELLARLRALLRRSTGHAAPVLSEGGIELDTRTARATKDGVTVPLTAFEYRVLAYLLHHRGRTVSQSELVEHVYAQDFDRDSNTIEVFVGRLRKKLGKDAITTVRGLGYRMGGT